MTRILTYCCLSWLLPLGIAVSLSVFSVSAHGMGLSFGGGSTQVSVPTLVVTPGPMASPFRIDLGNGKRGKLLVTDYGRNSVYLIDRASPDNVKLLFTMTGRPLGITQWGSKIFVGNETSGAVEAYNLRGRLLRSYRANLPMVPSDLAVDINKGWLFVADGAGKDVKIFNFAGRLERVIDGSGELFHPMGVAIDPLAGRIAVSDFGDSKTGNEPSLQLFDYEGIRLLKITGAFSSPRGIAFVGNQLFMVDALLGQVLVFDATTGAKLGTIGSFGTGTGQLLLPLDIVSDRVSQKLYITNNRLGRVTVLATGF